MQEYFANRVTNRKVDSLFHLCTRYITRGKDAHCTTAAARRQVRTTHLVLGAHPMESLQFVLRCGQLLTEISDEREGRTVTLGSVVRCSQLW